MSSVMRNAKVAKKFLLLLLMGVGSSAQAWTEYNKVVPATSLKTFRVHSVTHAATLARKMFQVYISGLQGGCLSVWAYADQDAGLYSMLLSVVATGSNVAIKYDADQRGLFGDATSCALTSVTLNES